MLAKARLVEIDAFSTEAAKSDPTQGGASVTVQFNPQSLKLNFQNQITGGDKPGGSETQFVGSSTSTLAVELLFDTTADGTDVRAQSKQVAAFLLAKPQGKKRIPPRLRFEWGSFLFEGIMVSMGETLDYFSIDGVPLRATLALNMTQPSVLIIPGAASQQSATGGANRTAPGTQPQSPVRDGESVPQAAARTGQSADWKAIAAANNIDDPLRLSAGATLSLDVSAGGSLGGSVGGSVGFSAGAGIGASVSAGIGADAQAGFGAGIGGGAGFSAGASVGLSASAGISAGFGASASAGGSFGASAGFGADAGAGFSAGASASASFGGDAAFNAQLTAGASASYGAGASFGADVGISGG